MRFLVIIGGVGWILLFLWAAESEGSSWETPWSYKPLTAWHPSFRATYAICKLSSCPSAVAFVEFAQRQVKPLLWLPFQSPSKEKVDIYAFALIMPGPQGANPFAAPVFSTFHKQMSTNQNEALAHRVSSFHCLVELLPSSNRWKGPCWVLAQSVWSKCHLKFILSTLPLPQTHIDHHRPCRTEGWKIRLGSMFVWGYSWPRYFMSAGKAPFYQLGKDPELATRDTSRCL